MKKLNLNVANLGATEVLSREELKKVLGGTGTGTGSVASCGELFKSYCGNTAGKSCKTSSGKSGTCKSPQATTQCVCEEV